MKNGKRNSRTSEVTRQLSLRVHDLRKEKGLSQRELAQRSNISFSAISKIENNQLSPTYDSLIRLAGGLDCDIADLFNRTPQVPMGRKCVTHNRMGYHHITKNYDYELLCNDISYKKMIPLRTTIKAKTIREFGDFTGHEGEELLFVLCGVIEVHTEFYQPELLHEGDCIYFDSTMKHACINKSDKDAEVLWVCTSTASINLEEENKKKSVR